MTEEIELANGVKLNVNFDKVISGSSGKKEDITVQLRITPQNGNITCTVVGSNYVMIQVNARPK